MQSSDIKMWQIYGAQPPSRIKIYYETLATNYIGVGGSLILSSQALTSLPGKTYEEMQPLACGMLETLAEPAGRVCGFNLGDFEAPSSTVTV